MSFRKKVQAKILLFSIFAILVFSTFFIPIKADSQGGWTHDLEYNITSYYKFDETSGGAIDSTGNHSDGTLHGVTQGTTGIINNSYSFDGNDYIALGNANTFVGNCQEVTVSVWFNSSDITHRRCLYSSDNGYNINDRTISSCFWDSGYLRVMTREGTTPAEVDILSTNFTTDGTWYNLIIVINDSSVAGYVNGELVESQGRGSGVLTNTSNLFAIGRLGSFNAYYHEGSEDELITWCRALTPSEVDQVYQNGLDGYSFGDYDEGNIFPNSPTLNSPSSGTTGVSTSPVLNVTVSDPEGNLMNVTFIDASDNSTICTNSSISNNSIVTCRWDYLDYNTTYKWYVNVTDNNSLTTMGDTWNFTTKNNPWIEELSEGLMTYYKLDNSSGWIDVTDNGYDGYNDGGSESSPDYISYGKINGASNFTASNNDIVKTPYISAMGKSIVFWGKGGWVVSNDIRPVNRYINWNIYAREDDCAGNGHIILISRNRVGDGGTGDYNYRALDTGIPQDNEYHFIYINTGNSAVVRNVTIDGNTYNPSSWGTVSGCQNAIQSGNLTTFDGRIVFGRYDVNGQYNYQNGSMDEVAIYNRSLSLDEITTLYNEGIGLPYFIPQNNPPPNHPTLNSPSSGTTGVSTSPVLNVTVSDPEGNLMNVTFIDASDNSTICTNSSISNNSIVTCRWDYLDYNTTYKWYVNVTDNNSLTTMGDTWNFTTKKNISWTEDLNNNLTAYWKFEEASGNWTDDMGNDDISPVGSVNYQDTGAIDYGMSTPWSASVVNYGSLTSFSNLAPHTNSFTMNAWFYPTDTKQGAIMRTGAAGNGDGYYMSVYDNKFRWKVADGSSSCSMDSNSTIPTNQWVMSTLVYDADANILIMYFDGEEHKSISCNLGDVNVGSTFFVNYAETTGGGAHHIDETGMWIGTALNSSEISTLYNEGNGLTYPY